jgi:hypothetical protein
MKTNRLLISLSVIAAVVLIVSSCATGGTGTAATEKQTATAEEGNGEGAEKAAEESVPEPEIRSVSLKNGKESVKTGEEVIIHVDAAEADELTFDFEGDGNFISDSTYRYSTFGIKTVHIRAQNPVHTTTKTFSFPVTGTAAVSLDTNEIQHSKNENEALISADIDTDGTYDTVAVFYNDALILELEKQDEYSANIPFVGEYTFQVRLYEQGEKVAVCNDITITGLNEPPVLNDEFSKLIEGNVGEELTFDLSESVTDPNQDRLRFIMEGAPDGVEFDERTGTFRWTPGQAGLYLIDFYVFDYPYETGNVWLQRMLAVE